VEKMKKDDISDGLKLLRAILADDAEYIRKFSEASPECLINKTFSKYELQSKNETVDIDFYDLHQFNLREVATVYGYPALAEYFEKRGQTINYTITDLIKRLKKICSLIIENKVTEFEKEISYDGDLPAIVIPSRFAEAHYSSQAKFVGTATLLDLVLIWNRLAMFDCLKKKGCFLSVAAIANVRDATAEQIELMRGTLYFTGRMVRPESDCKLNEEQEKRRKDVKEMLKFDPNTLAKTAFSRMSVSTILGLYGFKPSLITSGLKFSTGHVYADPLIDVFLEYIRFGNEVSEKLIMTLVENSVKFEANTLQRLLSKMKNDNNQGQYREDWVENAKAMVRIIIGSNPDQQISGEFLVSCLSSHLSELTAYLLLLLKNVDLTATYYISDKRTQATLLEIVRRYAPSYTNRLQDKVISVEPASDTDLSALVSASGEYEMIPSSDDIQNSNQILGEGSFATIYLGEWNGVGVAIKVIDTKNKEADIGLQSALVEAKMLSRVRHPHITQFFGVRQKDEFLCVIELLSTDLRKLLMSEKLSDNTKFSYIRQLLTALVYLQKRHIIHRDIKLENVLVNADRSIVKLCDFGLAVQLEPGEEYYKSKILPGTPLYLAPEVFLQKPSYFSAKSDMYSFAILLFALMTEIMPWSELSEHQISGMLKENKRPELDKTAIPKNVATLITFCWQGGPPEPKQSIEERYSPELALKYFDTQIKPKSK